MAVLVDLFVASDRYQIALVGADARVVARAGASRRTPISDASELPYVSASNTRVYYLNGDSVVHSLTSDGTDRLVTTVPGSATVRATFAVSPDDKRIAVATLDYGLRPVKLSLYVEDVGGGNRAVIFSSDNHYVWPIGWRAGLLVVGYLGPNSQPFNSKVNQYSIQDSDHPYGPNPYGVINYHLIDPVTAERKAIISGGGVSGLPNKSGTAVVQGAMNGWDGQQGWNVPHGPDGSLTMYTYGSYSASGSLSPDGQRIAACCPQPSGQGNIVIWGRDGSRTQLPISVQAFNWNGWLDDNHLVTGDYRLSDGTPSVVTVDSARVVPIDAHGIVVAIMPSSLDS